MVPDIPRRLMTTSGRMATVAACALFPHGGQLAARRNALHAMAGDAQRRADRAAVQEALAAAQAKAARHPGGQEALGN
jgi:hypothetical protein